MILAAHRAETDPRIGWLASSLAGEFEVCEIGVGASEAEQVTITRIADNHWRVCVPRSSEWDWVSRRTRGGMLGADRGQLTLSTLFSLLFASRSEYYAAFGFIGGTQQSARFRNHALYYLMVNAALIEAVRKLGPVDLIICCDLETLPAGCVLKGESGSVLAYDAHEYWPYSFPEMSPQESDFWTVIERTLLAETDLRTIVSPQLAELLSNEYGLPFMTLPNAVPLSAAGGSRSGRRADPGKPVEFLVQGGFAPERGLEQLIGAWPLTRSGSVLVLRGPDNEHKEGLIRRARATGLLGTRIVFVPPVSEGELIAAATTADVGLIPYRPTSVNHKFCCPNKLSQYMAAGLPILASETEFVAELVLRWDMGVVVDFEDPERLAAAVDAMAVDHERRARYGANAAGAFRDYFHWENFIVSFLAEVSRLAANKPGSGVGFDIEGFVRKSLDRAGARRRGRGVLAEIFYREWTLGGIARIVRRKQLLARLREVESLAELARLVWRLVQRYLGRSRPR